MHRAPPLFIKSHGERNAITDSFIAVYLKQTFGKPKEMDEHSNLSCRLEWVADIEKTLSFMFKKECNAQADWAIASGKFS